MADHIEKLTELAEFTDYEKSVYKALYSLNKGSVKEIAQESSVPKPKVYSILEKLHEEGFISLEAEEPKAYSVISPEASFKKVLENKRSEIEELKTHMEAAEEDLRPRKEEKFMEIMQGRENVLNFLANQLEEVEDEYVTVGRFVSTYTPLQSVMDDRRDEIDMRFLGSEKHSKDIVVQKYHNLGLKVRTKDMDAIPFRFSIYDNEKIALTLSSEDEGYTTIWTNHPSFVENMKDFFDYHWEDV